MRLSLRRTLAVALGKLNEATLGLWALRWIFFWKIHEDMLHCSSNSSMA
jgi:hypothetical protein